MTPGNPAAREVTQNDTARHTGQSERRPVVVAELLDPETLTLTDPEQQTALLNDLRQFRARDDCVAPETRRLMDPNNGVPTRRPRERLRSRWTRWRFKATMIKDVLISSCGMTAKLCPFVFLLALIKAAR